LLQTLLDASEDIQITAPSRQRHTFRCQSAFVAKIGKRA
jgi:hypothetical protein